MRKGTCIIMLLLPSALSAQLPPSCAALAGRIHANPSLPVALPSLDRPCLLRAGCVQVDVGIVQKQELDDVFKLATITEKIPLVVRVLNFNALSFELQWSTESTAPSPAFENLANLFQPLTPVLGAISSGVGGRALDGADNAVEAWIQLLVLSQACIGESLNRWNEPAIDSTGDSERRTLWRVGDVLAKALDTASTRRAEVIAVLKTAEQYQEFQPLSVLHQDVAKLVAELKPRIETATRGVDEVIGTRPRNTAVTLQGQVARRGQGKVGSPIVAHYYVKWSQPVFYHLGYAIGRIRSYSFSSVRALSGQDLFSITTAGDSAAGDASDDSSGPEAVAFMDYELRSFGANDRFGIGLSLGTGLSKPGRSLYAGASFRIFSRGFVSVGAVAASAERGEGKTNDGASGTDSRLLFKSLKEKGAVKPFVSFSLRLY